MGVGNESVFTHLLRGLSLVNPYLFTLVVQTDDITESKKCPAMEQHAHLDWLKNRAQEVNAKTLKIFFFKSV